MLGPVMAGSRCMSGVSGTKFFDTARFCCCSAGMYSYVLLTMIVFSSVFDGFNLPFLRNPSALVFDDNVSMSQDNDRKFIETVSRLRSTSSSTSNDKLDAVAAESSRFMGITKCRKKSNAHGTQATVIAAGLTTPLLLTLRWNWPTLHEKLNSKSNLVT